MSDDTPYKVGKNKPPKEHQFKKGHKRSTKPPAEKDAPIDLAALLQQPIVVKNADGRKKKILPFEAAFINIVQRAINTKNVRAIEYVLNQCIAASLVIKPTENELVIHRIPSDWDSDEWFAMYAEFGAPPWDGPRNGLPSENWREDVVKYG